MMKFLLLACVVLFAGVANADSCSCSIYKDGGTCAGVDVPSGSQSTADLQCQAFGVAVSGVCSIIATEDTCTASDACTWSDGACALASCGDLSDAAGDGETTITGCSGSDVLNCECSSASTAVMNFGIVSALFVALYSLL